jgi:hypothetical protein
MGKLVLLLAGVLTYMAFLSFENTLAKQELARLQLLYTSPDTQARAISALSR